MRNYLDTLQSKEFDKRGQVLEIYHENLIMNLYSTRKSSDGYNLVHVMRDGLVAENLRRDAGIHVPWEQIDYVDVKGPFLYKPSDTSVQVTLLPSVDPKERATLIEKWSIYQQRGDIPRSVVLVTPTQTEKVKSWFRQEMLVDWPRRMITSLGFVVVLAVIGVGYPLYVGGGSLVAAVAPKIIEVAPDAGEMAITQHPEWPLSTKLKIRAITTGLYVAPTNALMDVLGMRSNKLEHLYLVPIFWMYQFSSKETHVKLLADTMVKYVQNSN